MGWGRREKALGGIESVKEEWKKSWVGSSSREVEECQALPGPEFCGK